MLSLCGSQSAPNQLRKTVEWETFSPIPVPDSDADEKDVIDMIITTLKKTSLTGRQRCIHPAEGPTKGPMDGPTD